MKAKIKSKKLLIVVLLIQLIIVLSCNSGNKNYDGNISISGAFALYPLTVKWAEEYNKTNPEVRIDISAGGAGKGMTDALTEAVDLGMFSRTVSKEELEKGAWYIAVAKDAVLPTINDKNPYLDKIKEKGLARESFKKIFIEGNVKNWGELFDVKDMKALNVYTRSDACGAAEMFAKYLDGNQESLKGTGVFGDPGMADAIKKDVYGIGYNNDVYIYDIRTGKIFDGLEVLPIDLNSDGKITEEEDMYGSLEEIMRAIKDGRYPSPPARDLYFVAHGKPQKESVIVFLKWLLTEGQKYVVEAGYVELADEQIKEELKKLE